jgi:hypothetical protein
MATSLGKAIKANLFTRCRALYPNAAVHYGLPPTDQADDIVCIGEAGTADGLRADQETATLGTNRSRNETIFVSILISSWRGTSDQQLVTELVFDAMALLENDLRTDPTIAGAIPNGSGADVIGWQLTETEWEALPKGRYAELDVTVRCRGRI